VNQETAATTHDAWETAAFRDDIRASGSLAEDEALCGGAFLPDGVSKDDEITH
jgi:hypothetical protein